MAPIDCNPASKRANLGGVLVFSRFALSEADRSTFGVTSNPRLCRWAPYLGLIVWHLSEVLTDLNVNCEL